MLPTRATAVLATVVPQACYALGYGWTSAPCYSSRLSFAEGVVPRLGTTLMFVLPVLLAAILIGEAYGLRHARRWGTALVALAGCLFVAAAVLVPSCSGAVSVPWLLLGCYAVAALALLWPSPGTSPLKPALPGV